MQTKDGKINGMAGDYISLLVHSVFPVSIFMEGNALPVGYNWNAQRWEFKGDNTAQEGSLGPIESGKIDVGCTLRFRLVQ